ncbi:MAG TPA: hypothetical protein EYN67_13880, partial [Flavobacteriales bacterium]|nr:hypothetical protein [Flavobacteriales bacterium]
MSIKKYFEIAENIQSLASKTSNDISGEIESSGYHEQDIIEEERFIPYTDFSKPENFARYGSAEEYYDSSLKRIYGTYPYDGSLKERLEWQNDSTYLDLYLLEERYPRTNGYVIFSADGWGANAESINADGYALPDTSADYEYIFFIGGPNPSDSGAATLAAQFTGSNYYEPSMNRASNLQMDIATRGISVEFWLKKDADFPGVSSTREVIFDLWNGELASAADYGRLTVELDSDASPSSPFRVTLQSGSDDTVGFFRQDPAASTLTYDEVTDNSWHHYAFTFASASAGVLTRFYVDGNLNNETTLGTVGVNDINATGLQAHLGALVTAPSGSSAGAYYGKLSGSLDEFRYWKTQRTSKDIGRYWFTQVGGGVNTDPLPYIETQEMANVNLGVYFKFNEGITGVEATDSTLLDYSGRYSNGTWTGYTTKSRNTGSAIVSSSAATHEFLDPIIYSFHPAVSALSTSLKLSGSVHDVNNNAAVYNSIPAWITEEDIEGSQNVKQLTQILSSYFDTLQLQVENLSTLKDIRYMSGSFAKPLPFAEKLLTSTGMVAPNLFLDADLLEKLADRSEKRLYEKSLHDIKNTIYQNIYNNISFIYKSKGTEKSFRNLIRCFGIDDELIKTNMYANNVEYELRNNRRNVIVTDKFVNFNTPDNMVATVFNYIDTSNPNSVSYITSSAALTGGYATTLEAEILFPLKPSQASDTYFNTNTISASLFGVHGAEADSNTDTTWTTEDGNFQVYAIRDEKYSDNVKFLLTGTAGGYVPRLETSLYEDVYDNTRWNLSVRIKPAQFPLKGLVDETNSNYIVELHGVQAQAGEIMEQFTVSASIIAPPDAFMTSAKRAYIGAHRKNFTGSVLQRSDVKVNACRYWLDYLNDEALAGHILDTENHGALQPHLYAFEFNTSASFGDVKKIDTLVFNWEFLNNTGSAATGFLTVDDISSGSANTATFGELSGILNRQHTAQGRFFAASSTTAIDKDYVVSSKLNLPENVQSEDMIRVLNAQEQDVFTTESRPTNYYFAFEKSMYQVISEEMINYFANMKDFNNLIGDQVERYRPDYKQLSFMRQKFFEQVGNDQLDFDKFYEFYKWFDSSLSLMLGQLVPASADFSENVRTVIESHVLERPKYQQKFPFLQRKGGSDLTGSVDGNMAADASAQCSPEEYAQGTGMISNTAFTKRQIGSPNTSQVRPWKMFHAPANGSESENIYWHRYMEEKEDSPRTDLLKAIRSSFDRRVNSPIKFSTEGYKPVVGVARHPSNRPNYVFAATAPYGPTQIDSNIPINVLLSYDTDVEQLLENPAVYYPTYKQRLGFGMDPSINIGANRKTAGNTIAPFSLYSSSVTTGYNSQVVTQFKSGTMVTNLHSDFVDDHSVPLQGPFTEKYVGGRFYRHTALNTGADTRESRPEGFRIELGTLALPITSTLGIVPPNYPFNDSPPGSSPHGFLPATPTAQRFRDETAKRPVNIRNIQMTTGSTIIGNYEKNYQVINTGGRTQNDPFFQDQSFDFALNPETLATRGRFPLTARTKISTVNKSLLFGGHDPDGAGDHVEIGDNAYWSTAIHNTLFSVSWWFNTSNFIAQDFWWEVGGNGAKAHAFMYHSVALGGQT